MIGGGKPAAARWVLCARNALRGRMRVSRSQCAPSTTPLPPPHSCQRNRDPGSECFVRREFSTPGEVNFSVKAALVVGRVFGGLCGGEWAGLRYRYCNPRRRTADYRQTMALGVAMKRWKDLYRLTKETDYDPDPDSEDKYDESDSDSEFVDAKFSYIVVNTMSHHLLSNPVTFKQFVKRTNFRTSFDLSGPFSQKSILRL